MAKGINLGAMQQGVAFWLKQLSGGNAEKQLIKKCSFRKCPREQLQHRKDVLNGVNLCFHSNWPWINREWF